MGTTSAAIHKHIGLRIRCRRRECGLTQATLSARANIPIRELQLYELGIAPISAKLLLSVSRQLGADIGYFFRGIAWPPDSDGEDLPLPKQPTTPAASLRAASRALSDKDGW